MLPLTAALLGVQHPHSDTHLRTLQQLPEVEKILLWDPDTEALARFHATYGEKVVATYTDLAELLAQPEWRFAIGAVRTDQAIEIYPSIFAAGRHLLAEKPLGRDAQEAAHLVELARAAKVHLGVCYGNRRNPVVEAARQIVSEGVIGPLISVEVRAITTQVQFRNPAHWLFSQAKAGGGMLSWLGCHPLDLIRYITQDEIEDVSAHVATRSGEAIDVEDVATLSFRLQSGALGSLHTGYMLALSGGGYHNKSGYDNYFAVNGRMGRLFWSSPGAPSELYAESSHPAWAGAPQRTLRYTLGTSPAYLGAYGELFARDFIGAVMGQGAVPASGEDALQVARIVDGAYAASRTGQQVRVPPP